MRFFRGLTLAFGLTLAGLAAPSAANADGMPTEAFVSQVAQHLVIAELGLDPATVFEPAVVHPQPQGNFWAVVGRMRTPDFTGRWNEQVYVAAVVKTCKQGNDLETCWKLQKLGLDNEIVVDHGPPPKDI